MLELTSIMQLNTYADKQTTIGGDKSLLHQMKVFKLLDFFPYSVTFLLNTNKPNKREHN